jgi:hypothetical protein
MGHDTAERSLQLQPTPSALTPSSGSSSLRLQSNPIQCQRSKTRRGRGSRVGDPGEGSSGGRRESSGVRVRWEREGAQFGIRLS